MLPPNYEPNQSSGCGEKVVWKLKHVWAWQLSWISDHDYFSILVQLLNKYSIWNMIKICCPFFWRKNIHERSPCQPKLQCNFHKNFIYVISACSSIFLWQISYLRQISYLAQRVHVSKLLRHFPKFTHALKVQSNQKDFSSLIQGASCKISAKAVQWFWRGILMGRAVMWDFESRPF